LCWLWLPLGPDNASIIRVSAFSNLAEGMAMGVHEVVVRVLGERRRKAATLALVVLWWSFGTGCDFARRSGFRLGLITYSPDSVIELSFLVLDSKGNPLGHVAVLNQLGEQVGTSAEASGLVTIVEKFAHSSWYFRPEMELGGAAIDRPGETNAVAAGRFVVLSERERVLATQPIIVKLDALSAIALPSDLPGDLPSGSLAAPVGADPSGEAAREDGWESFRDTAPRLAGRPLVGRGIAVNFVEEDIDDGAQVSDPFARSAAADSVSKVLSTLSVSSGVALDGKLELHDFVMDSERSATGGGIPQPAGPSDGKIGGPSLSEVPVSLGEAPLGVLRQLESKTAEVARGNVTNFGDSGSDKDSRADRQSARREAAAQSGLQSSMGSSDVPVPHFPKAFARMESWGIPAEKTRRLSFFSRSPDANAASDDGADTVETVVKVYGISTQKESEVELGVISLGASQRDGQNPSKQDTSKQLLGGAGRLDVVVPEAARFDLVRAELPGCGGVVIPLLASSQAAPQELSCANLASGVNKTPSWTQTIGMMYLTHGAMRYFRGGKIDAGAQAADVSGNLSLFRLSTPVTSEGVTAIPVVHLRHPDIQGGESTLEQPVGVLNMQPNPPAHRLVALKNVQSPKPRVSVLVRRGQGARHVDSALVGRFERAFFAHFVNSKFFIPVPWQSLEQQIGTSLTFERAVAEGWRGSVLDLLIDYTIVLQPRERSTISQWYDREGKLVGQKEYPYRLDTPPELLAREVYDGLLDDLPDGTAAQTATR
jgi:hypothetical protein